MKDVPVNEIGDYLQILGPLEWDVLDEQSECDLIARAQAGDKAAVEAAFTQFALIVPKIVKRYSRRNRRFVDEMIQEGNIGLLDAIKTYDPAAGARFMTHAYWRVTGAIKNFIYLKQSLIRVPQITACSDDIKSKATRVLHITSLATKNRGRKSDSDLELGGLIEDASRGPVDEAIAREDIERCRARFMRIRSPRDRDIIIRIMNGDSISDIAKDLSITSERVDQLKRRALNEFISGRPFVLRWTRDYSQPAIMAGGDLRQIGHAGNTLKGLTLLASGLTVRDVNKAMGYSPNAHWFADNIKRKVRAMLKDGKTPVQIGEIIGANMRASSWAGIEAYIERLKAPARSCGNKKKSA